MTRQHKKKRPNLLSHTRPRSGQDSQSTLSARTTRSTIRGHHNLQKQLSQARAANNSALAAQIQAQLNDAGGLAAYQRASTQGQSSLRGGDSSRVLVQWIHELHRTTSADKLTDSKPRLLEIGALRPDNACARSGLFQVSRIDLRSQHPLIEEQDFMQRPVPAPDTLDVEGFDVISLSLVLNYVSEAKGRGDMLHRTTQFLRFIEPKEDPGILYPGLFLVLPAPCITNSRYLDEDRLSDMMVELGFCLVKKKYSPKLAYFYWRLKRGQKRTQKKFPKKEINHGSTRNNFAVVL